MTRKWFRNNNFNNQRSFKKYFVTSNKFDRKAYRQETHEVRDFPYLKIVMDKVLACITLFIFLIVCVYCYFTSLFRRNSSLSWNLCKYNSEIEVNGKYNNQTAKTNSEITLVNHRHSGKTSEYNNILKNARLRAEVEFLKGEQNSLVKKSLNNFYKPADLTFSQWAKDIMQQQRHLLQEPDPNSALKVPQFQGENWQQRARKLANHIRECELAAKAFKGEERKREEKRNIDLLLRNDKIEDSNKILELRIHLMKTERCLEESQEELLEVENEIQGLHEQVDSATLENKILQEQVDMLKQEIVLLNAHLDSVMKERDSYERLAISNKALWKAQLPRIKYTQERSIMIGLSSLTDEEAKKQKDVLKSLKGQEFQNSAIDNKQRKRITVIPTLEADKDTNCVASEHDVKPGKYCKIENLETKALLVDNNSKNAEAPGNTKKDELKNGQISDERTDLLALKENLVQKCESQSVSRTPKLFNRKYKNVEGYKSNSKHKNTEDKNVDLQQPLKRTKWTNSFPILAQPQLSNIPERDGEMIDRNVLNIGNTNVGLQDSLDDASSSVQGTKTSLSGPSRNENRHTSNTPVEEAGSKSESSKQQERHLQISNSSFSEENQEELEHLRFSDEDCWNSEHEDDEAVDDEDLEDEVESLSDNETIVSYTTKKNGSPRGDTTSCFKTNDGGKRPISDSAAFKNFLKSI